jgi:signal transduction histidine kinase
LYHKYKNDVFFSTQIKVIVSQGVLVLFVIVATVQFGEYVKNIAQISFIELINTPRIHGEISSEALNDIQKQISVMEWAFFIVVTCASIFVSYIATRVVLEPVKASLHARKRFIESIAHELRTSLSILKTQNEVAKMESDAQVAVDDVFDKNIEEVDYISGILNSLLLFNHVDSSQNIDFEAVSLNVLIDNVAIRLRDLAKYRSVALYLEKSTIPLVHGNIIELEQMLFNLIKNAITYTAKGGSVTVEMLESTESTVTLQVIDTGIGIAKEELPHIFKLFYRANTPHINSSGTGLGLALVYEIVKLHHGKIHVESSVGVGTKFVIVLPRLPEVTIETPSIE